MTFSQNPFEVRWLRTDSVIQGWLLFSPASFLQGQGICFARYEVTIILRDSLRVFAQYNKKLSFTSTIYEELLQSNILSFPTRLPFSDTALRWEIYVYDEERYKVYYETGTLPPPTVAWEVSFFQEGLGWSINALSDKQVWYYSVPAGTYLGMAALYVAERSVPELTRYLSIEEKRFTVRATGGIDTLWLEWLTKELPPGRYLIGLYLYAGEKPLFQAFYPVRRK
ncbi:MAG: hypothetical protein N3A68_06570 [Bacteroidia bacterium]|jgi:hypothetical protein|nr:hypothetical protein [Bacteroidia bacterium]GIV22707.1 MAG: hypothetical protein KatS3mg025_0366 [Bacteroidia bacterium]